MNTTVTKSLKSRLNNMEFRDLKAQYNNYKKEIDNRIEQVMMNSDFIGGKEVEILEEKTKLAGLTYSKYKSVKEALSAAQKNAKENDLVFVGGSTFTVAEVV